MRNIIAASLAFLGGTLSATAATSLNSGGNIRVASGWSNNLPSSSNEGTVTVDGISSGADTFGYGAGAVINHTAGNIVAEMQSASKRRGFNLNGGGTWKMSGGSLTARYFNANGSNSIIDLSGGTITIETSDGSVTQFQQNNGGLIKISGSVVLDGSDATASPLVGSGAGYEFSSNWTGSWIQGNHSGTAWKTVLTTGSGFRLDGDNITSEIFDTNFRISPDGQTLTMSSFTDTDNDGIDDFWETQNGLTVGIDDSASDNDSDGGPDGLTNLQEFLNGTNPQAADTDGDGINDGDEIAQGSSPLDPADPVAPPGIPITVYLLGGQSNMEGSSFISGPTPEENLSPDLLLLPEILMYVAGHSVGTNTALSNQLLPLQPHSAGSGGVAIGPEIGFGERMRELCPGKNMAFLKYAYRGTNLHTQWDPGANNGDTANWGIRYTSFVSTITNGLAALRAEGYEPQIEGMLWMQGENDALNTTNANAYGANLSHFIGRVREQFAADTVAAGMRFVAGQVLPAVNSSYPGRDAVRQAILDVDENSGATLSIPNTASVPTNVTDHPLRTDNVHLNLVGILALGRSMAYHMLELEEIDYDAWATINNITGSPDGDDDQDGISNRLEFILGGDPQDAADRPTQSVGEITVDGVSYASYTFPRNLNAADATAEAQLSYDLEDWASFEPVFVSSVSQPDGSAVMTFRSIEPVGPTAPPRAFFRVGAE